MGDFSQGCFFNNILQGNKNNRTMIKYSNITQKCTYSFGAKHFERCKEYESAIRITFGGWEV